MTKRLLAVLAATVFTLSLARPALSAGMGGDDKGTLRKLAGHMEEELAARMGGDVKGTVTKIEGTTVTIKDSMGTEKTIDAMGPEELKDLKVGDRVAVKDGKVMKEGGGGAEPSRPSPDPKSGPKY
jgi:hypothetical protein